MIPINYNIGSLKIRRATTAASLLGIALVVFVMAAALMLSQGVHETLGRAGSPDTAIVVRNGSNTEMASIVERQNVSLIEGAPGVRVDASGKPLGVGEVVVVAAMEKIGAHGFSNVQLRGVPDNVWDFRPEVKIVEGRKPTPGSNEVAIGKRIAGRFKGLQMGGTFDLKKNRPVTVVGVFEARGSSYESEVWADENTLSAAFGRTEVLSSVRVRLTSPAAFEGFKAAVEQDKRLGLGAKRETDYYEEQSEGTSTFVNYLGITIAIFFSVGAMIGAMITLYASIASRQREIGVLKALGFPAWQVLTSFMLESMVIAALGGLVGILAALAVGTVKFSMMNFESWSEIVFSFHPTPAILLKAFVFAGVMGLIGGFLPAVRAARLNTIAAIRGE